MPIIDGVNRENDALTATIANGASLSDAQDCGSRTLLAIHMPAAWTAADLTFSVSDDGVTYSDLYDDVATEKTVKADASRYLIVSPADWAGIRFIKVRSGTSAAAVAQGAERLIKLITKEV